MAPCDFIVGRGGLIDLFDGEEVKGRCLSSISYPKPLYIGRLNPRSIVAAKVRFRITTYVVAVGRGSVARMGSPHDVHSLISPRQGSTPQKAPLVSGGPSACK